MANCSESPLLDNCNCSSKFGPGSNTKVYDMESQQYLCCGNKVPYDMATLLTSHSGNLIDAAASADDTRCVNWWHTNIDPTKQNAVTGAGPTQAKLDAVQHMANISAAFPPPSIDGKTNTYSCTGKVSSLSGLHTVPRYLSFKNPNAGENYTELVACVPHDDSKSSTPYSFLTGTSFNNNEDFAIFTMTGCNNLNLETCVTPIDKAPVGSLEFSSVNYNGSKFPSHDNSDDNVTSNMTWIIILVLCGVVVIMLLLLIWAWWRSSRRSVVYTEVPMQVNQTPQVIERAPMREVIMERQPVQQPVMREVVVERTNYSPVTRNSYINPVQGFEGGNYTREFIPDSAANNVLRG